MDLKKQLKKAITLSRSILLPTEPRRASEDVHLLDESIEWLPGNPSDHATKSFAHPGELIMHSLTIIPFMRIFCGNRKLFIGNCLPSNAENS